MNTRRLSPAQQRMLARLTLAGVAGERPPAGSGTLRSAWVRTLDSLGMMGLAQLVRVAPFEFRAVLREFVAEAQR